MVKNDYFHGDHWRFMVIFMEIRVDFHGEGD
jgi:hypothetical protein